MEVMHIKNRKKLFLILLMATFAAIAAQTVIVNSTRYTCPNECVVRTYPGGGTSVADSKGGEVKTQALTNSQPPLDP